MANWNNLKAAVAQIIKANNNQEITGTNMQSVLNSIIDNVGENATLAGIATPSTNPGAPDGNAFYLATQAGTYANFGGRVLEAGLNVLLWNGSSWGLTKVMTIAQELGDDENKVISQKGVTQNINEYNVSANHPTEGIDGTNKYTLETAIAKIPSSLRNVGLKCSFLNEAGEAETWENINSGFTNILNWQQIGFKRFKESVISNFIELGSSLATQTGYINTSGEEAPGSTRRTDYLLCIPGLTFYVISKTNSYAKTLIAFYDSGKQFISGLIANASGAKLEIDSVVSPNGTAYVRFCYDQIDVNRFFYSAYLASLWELEYYAKKDALRLQKSELEHLVSYSTRTVFDYNSLDYLPQKYITSNGTILNWGPNRLYKLKLEDYPNIHYLFFKRIKSYNAPFVLGAFFDDSENMIESVLQVGANQIVENIIFDLTEEAIPENATYFYFSVADDYRLDDSYKVYALSAGFLKDEFSKEFMSVNSYLNSYQYVLEEDITTSLKMSIGYISYDGILGKYGNDVYITDYLELTGRIYRLANIMTIPSGLYVVSFFDENKILVDSYTDFRYNHSSGAQVIDNIIVKCASYPLARYIRISGKLKSEQTKIYSIDFHSVLKRVSVLEEAIADSDFSKNQPIMMIGDSIASQIGAALVNNIGTIDGREIQNKSVGGESCLDTLAKKDFIPYAVLPFTVPSGTTQSEAIDVLSSLYLRTAISDDGVTKTYYNSYNKGENNEEDGSYTYGMGINPWDYLECCIGGIEGTLYFTRSNPSKDNNYFIRKEAGTEVAFDRPQLVIPKEVLSKNATYICFMGTNGGWNPIFKSDDFNACADILVNYYKTIVKKINTDNYLFLGFYMTAFLDQVIATERIARWKYFEDRMVEEFGSHYFSVRQYLREYGWKDAGYQLGYRLVTEEGNNHYTCLEEDIVSDKQAIADGKIPYCIVNGESGVHMLSKPSACVANQVIKRLYELGLITECPQIDISTIVDAENADINEPDYGN